MVLLMLKNRFGKRGKNKLLSDAQNIHIYCIFKISFHGCNNNCFHLLYYIFQPLRKKLEKHLQNVKKQTNHKC